MSRKDERFRLSGLRTLQTNGVERGRPATLLGIGPLSRTVLQAAFEAAREEEAPLLFIASRNQVEAAELGGGYVNDWNPRTFCAAVETIAAATGFNGPYYICRDHGGPWQRDQERSARLPEQEAMSIAKQSYLADLLAGFDLLHIDPTRDPHREGVVPMEVVIRRTVELMEYVETERKRRGLPEMAYEIGTEETNGGLTDEAAFTRFITGITAALKERALPAPTFIVGQTGTLVRMDRNVGEFDPTTAKKLSAIAAHCGLALKEHNADYMTGEQLLFHPALGIHAANVAPEFGAVETGAYLSMAALEQQAWERGWLEDCSRFPAILAEAVLDNGRWAKWMTAEYRQETSASLRTNAALLSTVVRGCGHYVFNAAAVTAAREKMLVNMRIMGIDGGRQAVDAVKAAIRRYIEAFNLQGFNRGFAGQS